MFTRSRHLEQPRVQVRIDSVAVDVTEGGRADAAVGWSIRSLHLRQFSVHRLHHILHFLAGYRNVVDFFTGVLHRLQIKHRTRYEIFAFAESAFDSIDGLTQKESVHFFPSSVIHQTESGRLPGNLL